LATQRKIIGELNVENLYLNEQCKPFFYILNREWRFMHFNFVCNYTYNQIFKDIFR